MHGLYTLERKNAVDFLRKLPRIVQQLNLFE